MSDEAKTHQISAASLAAIDRAFGEFISARHDAETNLVIRIRNLVSQIEARADSRHEPDVRNVDTPHTEA